MTSVKRRMNSATSASPMISGGARRMLVSFAALMISPDSRARAATAAANAVLGEIEDAGLVANAARRGDQLRAAIAAIGSPLVSELRGAGLLIGIGLAEPIAAAVSSAALAAGLIINAPNDTSIRLAPPLIIGDAEVAEFVDIFTTVISSFPTPEATS